MPHLNRPLSSTLKSALAVRQAQAPSKVEGMQGSTDEATGLSAEAGRQTLAKAEDVRSWVLRGSRATENAADDVLLRVA
jgi:hypothetical protein